MLRSFGVRTMLGLQIYLLLSFAICVMSEDVPNITLLFINLIIRVSKCLHFITTLLYIEENILENREIILMLFCEITNLIG